MSLKKLPLLFILFSCVMASFTVYAQQHNIDWNDDQLTWLSYDEGINELHNSKGVGLLILYADWCPTCKAYSGLFKKPAVVKSLQGITLIRANIDDEPLVNALYDKDGTYIPRTFALNSMGDLIKPLQPDKPRYDYFLPVEQPRYLVDFARGLKAYIGRD